MSSTNVEAGLDFTAGTFELDQRVLELWRKLSEPLDVIEPLIVDLNSERFTEVFEELEAYIHSEPTIVDAERFNRTTTAFYQGQHPKKCPIGRFVRLTAENIYQHADVISRDVRLRTRRSVRIEPPYARSLIVVQYSSCLYFDMYTLDNGKGFIHPTTGKNIIDLAIQYQRGFGPNSDHGVGLSTALDAVDSVRIISAGKMFGKDQKDSSVIELNLTDELKTVPGSLVCGRVRFNPRAEYIQY